MKAALLHFKHIYPTSEELTTTNPIDITDGSFLWISHKFEDDPLRIEYDMNKPVLFTNYIPIKSGKGYRVNMIHNKTCNPNPETISEETKEEFFHDSQEPDDKEFHSYFDPDTQQKEYLKYYDPSDKIPMKVLYGRAIPLSID